MRRIERDVADGLGILIYIILLPFTQLIPWPGHNSPVPSPNYEIVLHGYAFQAVNSMAWT